MSGRRGKKRRSPGICDRWCRDCRYYQGRHNASRCCNYLLLEGRMRPCPAGTGCTAKAAGEAAEEELAFMRPVDTRMGGKL